MIVKAHAVAIFRVFVLYNICRSICDVLATAASRCSFWLQLVIENSQRMKFAISMETQ